MLLSVFHKMEKKGTVPNFFYQNPVKTQHNPGWGDENYRPISQINIHVKILKKKPLANQIQEHHLPC